MRSKTSLGSSREIAQGCGVSFTNCLHLIPLIIGQNFCATCATHNQTGPSSDVGSNGVAGCRDRQLLTVRFYQCQAMLSIPATEKRVKFPKKEARALVVNTSSCSVQIPELMPDWCRTATIFLGRVYGAHDHILSDGSWVTPDAWLHKLIFCERL